MQNKLQNQICSMLFAIVRQYDMAKLDTRPPNKPTFLIFFNKMKEIKYKKRTEADTDNVDGRVGCKCVDTALIMFSECNLQCKTTVKNQRQYTMQRCLRSTRAELVQQRSQFTQGSDMYGGSELRTSQYITQHLHQLHTMNQ